MTSRSASNEKRGELMLQRGQLDVSQSFHSDFIGNPFIIVRNLAYSLSEGDVVTMFEQYGTIVGMELIRDEYTGHSKGTAIIQYQDARSAILAVDNFNGCTLLGRVISVDHLNYSPGPKSNLVDPRTLIPARLNKNTQSKPVFDVGSEPSTDSE